MVIATSCYEKLKTPSSDRLEGAFSFTILTYQSVFYFLFFNFNEMTSKRYFLEFGGQTSMNRSSGPDLLSNLCLFWHDIDDVK